MQFNRSPFGLKVMSRRGRDPIDDLVWEAGSLDWASLRLLLGGDVKTSLAEAEKVVNVWREHLRDAWDWRDLTRSDDGQPWCNSHYARQLIFWSIPLVLSGQQYSAAEKKLLFAPRPMRRLGCRGLRPRPTACWSGCPMGSIACLRFPVAWNSAN